MAVAIKYTKAEPVVPNHWWENEAWLSKCLECGRPVGDTPSHLVEIGYGGGEYWAADNEFSMVQDGGYMGKYPIGSECAKKFEAGILYTGQAVQEEMARWT
jgi:hypothetical protein